MTQKKQSSDGLFPMLKTAPRSRAWAFLLALFAVLIWAGPLSAATVIYYDGAEGEPNGILGSNMLLNLVGHFDDDAFTREVGLYEAGDMAEADHVLYLGTDWETPLPEAFLEDVASAEHRVMWIDGNLHQLTEYLAGPGVFGFEFVDWNPGEGLDRIDYKERMLVRAEDLSFIDIDVTGSPTVYSYITASEDADQEHPHFLCGADLCFLAENPMYFEGADDRMLVLADLLHEFFQTEAPEQKVAMLRLEDLSAGAFDLDVLLNLTALLEERDVPFGIGVIPFFRDPEGLYNPPDTEIALSDIPDFVDILAYMINHGGTLVMHGVTHQWDPEITGLGWEFSLGFDGTPLSYDSGPWARDRIELGLAEFMSQGWEPKIWETPHYSASHGDYHVFAEHFQTFWERPLVFPVAPEADPVFGQFLEPISQTIPYYTTTGSLGVGILPETLGYVDIETPEMTPEALLEKADRISIIRDGVACFFFHHTLIDLEDLLAVLDGLSDRGYTFVGPEDYIGDDGMGGGEDPDFGDDDDDHDGGCGC